MPLILRILAVVVVLGAIAGGFFYYKHQEAAEAAARPMSFPPVTVSTIDAKSATWRDRVFFVGNLRSQSGLEIKPQTAGQVESVEFESGQTVGKGDVLVRLKADVEKAQLQKAVAAAQLAKSTYERNRSLAATNNIAAVKLDQSKADLAEARAEVGVINANLENKIIRAPVHGKVGIRKVNPGEVIDPATVIAVFENAEGLFVDFEVPQGYADQVDIGQLVGFNAPGYDKPFSGIVTGISPQISPSSRSLAVQAVVDSSDTKLYAGMFVEGHVVLDGEVTVVVVPQTAISYSLSGNTVYAVEDRKDDTGTAKLRLVRVGERRNSDVAILDGVKSGETVVTAGQIKLRNDAPVKIDNSVDTATAPAKPSKY